MSEVVKSFVKTHFISPTAPTTGVKVGTLWSDTTAALLKRCTSISPITFVSVESGGGGGFYQTIKAALTPFTQRAAINFTGAGVTVTDDAGNGVTQVDIPGGGAGSDVKTKVYKDGVQVGTVARQLDFRGSEINVTEDAPNDQFDVEVIAVRTFSRSDNFAATGNGVQVDASTYPIQKFSIQVKGTGAVPTSWTVVLEASLDGTNYETVLTHDNTFGDGRVKFSGAAQFPARYFRSRCTALTLGGASNIVVTILGSQ